MTYQRKISRRSVLKGVAAGALAAPLFVSGRALGLEDKAAASERITVGHIGVGQSRVRYLPLLPVGAGFSERGRRGLLRE